VGFDAKAFVKRLGVYPDAVYEKGFNACLVDHTNKDEFVQLFAEAVKHWSNVLEELSKNSIERQIDIGVTVGTKDQYTCSIALPVEVMKVLTDQGVQIVFSAYPASDETESS